MNLYLTPSDYEYLQSKVIENDKKIQKLHLEMGEAANLSSSFVDTDPTYTSLKSQVDELEKLNAVTKNLLSKVTVSEITEFPNVVTNYSIVSLSDCDDGKEIEYYIQIAGLQSNHIGKEVVVATPQSPVGISLWGAKVGDTVDIQLPNRLLRAVITEITKV